MQDALQTTPATSGPPVSNSWSMEFADGKAVFREAGTPVFAVKARTERHLNAFLHDNVYSAATAFIRGEFDVEGDIVGAVRWRSSQPRSGMAEWFLSAAAKLARTCFSLKSKAARNVQFHYDRSNQFYQTFLDSRRLPNPAMGWATRAAPPPSCAPWPLAFSPPLRYGRSRPGPRCA